MRVADRLRGFGVWRRSLGAAPELSAWALAGLLAGALAVGPSGCGGNLSPAEPGLGSSSPDAGSVVQQPRPDAGVAGGGGAGGGGAGSGGSSDGGTPLCVEGTCKTCTSTAGCSADAPVCDTDANGGLGQCKKVEVIAFYTPDPEMDDRAHAAYTRHANVWFPQTAGTEQFFTYESTTDWDRLSTMTADKGRIVMFLDNVPGDPSQQTGFQSYMEKGGAWMGCHVSAYNDDSSNWDWYFNEFTGTGHFDTNTWLPTSANLHVEDSSHPLSQGLGAMFASAPSEWYSWVTDLRTKSNIEIILSIDPSSFPVGTDPNQSWYSGYYPVAWTNKNYKMLYVNMGHEQMDYGADTATSSTFDSPTQNKLYVNAFKWLGGAQQ